MDLQRYCINFQRQNLFSFFFRGIILFQILLFTFALLFLILTEKVSHKHILHAY